MKAAAIYSAAVTAAIMPLVYWVTWRVLTGPFSGEVQSMVVGAVVGSGLGAITGFWLGSSASSQRKDERGG
jgi:membrane protein YqaA with SNARE-associated domain